MRVSDLDYMVMVRLDVSIWSGRAKLRREDLASPMDLPPDTLATLGSKRLYDPGKLTIFNTLKARAVKLLNKTGVRFLGGWATHEDRLPAIDNDLYAVASEFNQRVQEFVQGYEAGVNEWVKNFPEYQSALLAAIVPASKIQQRFSFTWQAFKVAPANIVSPCDGFGTAISTIGDTLTAEIAASIKEIYEESFAGKRVVTVKAFRPVWTVVRKLEGLAFMRAELMHLARALRSATTEAEANSDNAQVMAMYRSVLLGMQSAEAIGIICAAGEAGAPASLDPFWAAGVPQPVDEQSASAPHVAAPVGPVVGPVVGPAVVPVGPVVGPVVEALRFDLPRLPVVGKQAELELEEARAQQLNLSNLGLW